MDGENCEERKVNYEFRMMNRNRGKAGSPINDNKKPRTLYIYSEGKASVPRASAV
jgi:hypothetical protein